MNDRKKDPSDLAARLLLAAGLCTVSLVGCGGDASDDVRDAHDAELEAQRQQDQNAAEYAGDARENRAEDQSNAIEAQAAGAPEPTQDRVEAEAAFIEERQVVQSQAVERLEKLDARIEELRTLIARAGPKATTQSKETLQQIEMQRTAVAQELNRLPVLPGDAWNQAKRSLDERLDELSATVDKAGEQVDAFT